ncbi:anthranilate 1,2-dioxygenase regulatory protein AndR [Paraburkholderia sp. BCC1886]|uniref:anthranilate 1,2-dioxygenase regulatory protein AndR n=1 Tax=Paraburkholderia sp. BCC1886 TaxID=2562670 RepID=UPI001183D167|nr:anthranilate 1,2-dioxygenase regulatory protein AndR [Paraburkholderia sp. BCC1886]
MHQTDFLPHALRRHRLFESTDIDETRELISRVMQPHSLIPSGRGNGRSHMDFVKIGRLGIGTIAFGTAMRVNVEEVDGYYLMMFCISGEAEVSVAGRNVRVNSERGILRAPGEPFSALLSPDCEQLVMRIDPASFRGDDDARKAPKRFDPVVPLSSDSMRAWKEQLRLVASSPELLSSACANSNVGSNVEALLVSLLDAGRTNSAQHYADRVGVPGFVRRAEELMHAQLSAPLRLIDIAEAAGVPVRTLCDGFLHFRQTSPMQYLKQLRLERARQAILESPSDVRIASIALDCGFSHLGRFAISYRERFGELPSDSVRKR